ncbi:hypothetical protein HanXRQr2_Chr08g0331381 [Helianthus annuus]|uniref:Uncharacterized protein n=1 Tax=Helianthus annuus TaxID=4232 RepID=A0A9K3ID85_HELAN|nr:hypothetical protein HanXRQr2_Chr08g0331381 [Helianthus annuus]KAJ0901014.1 hypothetical protein HanPSC8_Chr08g0320391 [Helianthus annuus]
MYIEIPTGNFNKLTNGYLRGMGHSFTIRYETSQDYQYTSHCHPYPRRSLSLQ